MKFNGSFGRLMVTVLFISILFNGCKKDKPEVKSEYSHNLLSADKYDKLIVEIQSMNGFQPTSSTVNNLKSFLEARLNKPGGITFTENTIAAQGKSIYTYEDVKNIEKANRSQQGNSSTIVAYFLFLDGDYSENTTDSKVLGIAYGQASMAIFEKTIRQYSGGFGKPSLTSLESTVILHEFGHSLGLVNYGTAMQTPHQDEANGAHCNNKDCLMYYASETSNVIGNIMGGVPSLDANCLNDLKANGGK